MTISYQNLADANTVWSLVSAEFSSSSIQTDTKNLVESAFNQSAEVQKIFSILIENYKSNFL